jgi:hypothetical protein
VLQWAVQNRELPIWETKQGLSQTPTLELGPVGGETAAGLRVVCWRRLPAVGRTDGPGSAEWVAVSDQRLGKRGRQLKKKSIRRQ